MTSTEGVDHSTPQKLEPLKPTVCVDFDGVIVEAKRDLADPSPFAPLIPGAIEGLKELCEHFQVVILTSRDDHAKIFDWLSGEHDVPIAMVTSNKVPAVAYIDDRAIEFRGDWSVTLAEVLGGRPHDRRGT